MVCKIKSHTGLSVQPGPQYTWSTSESQENPCRPNLAKISPIEYNRLMVSMPNNLKKCSNLIQVPLLLLLVLGMVSCFSFRVEVPLDPECVIDTLVIVKTIPAKEAMENKIVAEAVATTDANIYALIKVLQLSKPLKLQWHWYTPDNQLLRKSKIAEINTKSKYLSYFVAWDALPQIYYAEKKGRWTVLITADDAYLAKTEFEIN